MASRAGRDAAASVVPLDVVRSRSHSMHSNSDKVRDRVHTSIPRQRTTTVDSAQSTGTVSAAEVSDKTAMSAILMRMEQIEHERSEDVQARAIEREADRKERNLMKSEMVEMEIEKASLQKRLASGRSSTVTSIASKGEDEERVGHEAW